MFNTHRFSVPTRMLEAKHVGPLEPFNEFYERLIARGKSVKQVTYALAGKLACIAYHVLKDGVYKGILKKRLRVPKGEEVDVKDFDVGDALNSLSP